MKTTSLAAILSLVIGSVSSVQGQILEWERPFGTSAFDDAWDVATDGLGGVYVAGRTEGDLEGMNAGLFDAFLRKYDADGLLQWTRQFGSSVSDESRGVAADGLGNVYVSGFTYGDLEGTSLGGLDAFVRKYDSNGLLQWTRQLGTGSSDGSTDVWADVIGNVYITGGTTGSLEGDNSGKSDAFIRKYDTDGVQQWTRQFGSSESEGGEAVSVDGNGNVYVTGATRGSLDGNNFGFVDVFLSKYDSNGVFQWNRQLGTTANDLGHGVSADGLGNVFVVGRTSGDLDGDNAGGSDAFVSKFDANGALHWTRQLGTGGDDANSDITADGLGGVHVSGWTFGDLEGTNVGGIDAFFSKYDTNGTLEWTQQFGTNLEDLAFGMSTDMSGTVYIAGATNRIIGQPGGQESDAFVAKFLTDVPITPGDTNFDGKVDGLDYLNWAEHFGADPSDSPPGSVQNGDFNDDGVVDGVDYVIWAQNYGQGPHDAVAVPEPGSLLLLAIGLLFLPRRRH